VYPRNAASPEPIAIGPVVQISDGAVQSSGVTVRIKPVGVSEADGGGTTAYSTDGVVLYTPTQAETNYTSFVLIAKKTGCIPASVTVVTTASATAGYAGVDWSKVTAATTTVALSGTTISTSQVVASVTGAVGSVTGAVGSVTAAVTVGTNNDKTGYSLTQAFPANFAALGINASGHVSRVTLVDTTTVNSDMRGTDNAALASAWTSTRAGYLDSVLLAANANRTVQVTGSNHVAADIHELQPAVITDAAFAAGWLTAAGTAADYITELQTALGTAANQTAILDRVSFALSALAGNCSTAQTATETYVLSIGGNTYTAAYSGLDASGNRGTTTLTKA
jgi:hypothetical protein